MTASFPPRGRKDNGQGGVVVLGQRGRPGRRFSCHLAAFLLVGAAVVHFAASFVNSNDRSIPPPVEASAAAHHLGHGSEPTTLREPSSQGRGDVLEGQHSGAPKAS